MSTPKASKFARLSNIGRPDEELANPRQSEVAKVATSTRRLEGALTVPLALLVPNPHQARQIFDEASLLELSDDIKERGILEPLIVRERQDKMFEIIAGERRYRAAQLAGLTELPVIVKGMDERQARFATLVENIQREDLDPRDEKRYFELLQSEFNLSINEVAQLVHKSRMYVSRRLNEELVSQQPREDSEINHEMHASFISLNNSQYSRSDAGLDSEENHEMHGAHILSQKSQKARAKRTPKLNPIAFKRFSRTIEETLQLLDTSPDNPKQVEQLREEVTFLEEKLGELKKKLESKG